jgi:hypothetical protein
MPASSTAYRVAKAEEVVEIALAEVGGPEVGRSALTAVSNHRTLDLRNRRDREKP